MLQRRPLLPAVTGMPLSSGTSRSRRCRFCLRVTAVGWDPEGILAAPKAGHLNRRNLERQMMVDKDLQEQADRAREEARKELLRKREGRVQPSTHQQLVEYFLDTEGEEMEYETVRCRPLITEDFFTFIGEQIGQERFAKSPNQDRVAELEGLRDFLASAIAQVDEQARTMAAPRERLMALLGSQDKRATLLQMAGNNEIDDALLRLLQHNIDAARAAGQEAPASAMEKIRDAARRFMLKA